jgi:hypothetical protein
LCNIGSINPHYSAHTLTAETLNTSNFMLLQVPEIRMQLSASKTAEEEYKAKKRYINYPEILSEVTPF